MGKVKTNKIECRTCHKNFESWQKLALHISLGSCKGKRFAAHVLQDVKERKEIKKVPVNPDYVKTEFGDENRKNATITLSGENEYANTYCPDCKHGGIRVLVPAEYVNGKESWRNNVGDLVIICSDCQKKYRSKYT